ncbi:cAMP-binding domain of CRP or a regulatory subunit of cAMP-dependent protein kinases [Tropicibacter naphthalenivorans]|uniref:Nitrogen fixation regulation protein FixK n=2 Tax=Tropicibacter naphthalenivorans TaxID=441103 RepID=A0A0P1G1F2_9RHOB|nr:Nitrogen fixation regulation protein FixK [Tropicibacter naphthalenivorans]SMC43184.1 cAMP-binding domain of CRP or a regulatory subunit of cAMP-dependent protein kinases [Tropicibacter naphthalenivorans]
MTSQCSQCPLRATGAFAEMTPAQLEATQRFKTSEVSVIAGADVLSQGQKSDYLYTVLRGMGLRQVTLPDGARQVIGFVLPGDFLGLQAGVMGEMGHSVVATTDMMLCRFRREDLWALFGTCPERAYDITHLAAREEHMLGEALAVLGQKPALERVAWALHKLFTRLTGLGLGSDGVVALPFRQQDLADALGLSLVHTNKTLAKLRDTGVANWTGRRLVVPDPSALLELSDVPQADLPPRPLI